MEELSLPDTYHGRTTPKVKYLEIWKTYDPYYASTPRRLDPLVPAGSPRIFVWSDLHFGHNNIIKYAERPFPNTDLMNACLIGNYLNAVTANDIVIFGGDIGFMSENKINDILNSLPGYKIQIIGNHDIHRNGKLYELAFDERHASYVIDVDDVDASYQLLFTHYPMNDVPSGCINVHGHIHQKPAPSKRHFNMSVECTNYAPCPLSTVLTLGHNNARAGI
jgi:calcineurin-like phosphoesterase family protein